MPVAIGYGGASFPATLSLHFSEDDLEYEWNEAGIFVHDESGYYAFTEGAGCSCYYFEEGWDEEYFKHELIWHPTVYGVLPEMDAWVSRLSDPGERVDKRSALNTWLAGERS